MIKINIKIKMVNSEKCLCCDQLAPRETTSGKSMCFGSHRCFNRCHRRSPPHLTAHCPLHCISMKMMMKANLCVFGNRSHRCFNCVAHVAYVAHLWKNEGFAPLRELLYSKIKFIMVFGGFLTLTHSHLHHY